MMERIADVLLIFSAGGLLYILLATLVLVLGRAKYKRENFEISSFPPVTILKPLKGLDDQLDSNLRSFFKLDYPVYELIFGTADIDDPAICIVKKLRDEYPQVDVKLVVDNTRIGLNPKANNLNNMYLRSNYDSIIINDGNIRVGRDYLKDMVMNLNRPGIGLVTSTIRGVGNSGLGSILENLHLNTYIASSAMPVNNLVGIPVSIGKSIAIKKEIFEKLGGFKELCDYLQEDELLGRRVKSLGLKTHISHRYVDNFSCTWRLFDFISRHQRWATMRRYFKLSHYVFEPLSNPLFLAIMAFLINPGNHTMLISALIFSIKITLDFMASRAVDSDILPHHFILVPFKDIIIGAIWFVPFFYSEVNWRGDRYRVSKGTRLVAIEKSRFLIWKYGMISLLSRLNSGVNRIGKLFPKAKSYILNLPENLRF